jgi:hypothetical protein
MTSPVPNWQPPAAEPRNTAGWHRAGELSGAVTWEQGQHRHSDGRVSVTRVWPGQRIEDDMSSTAKREFSAEERHQLAAAGKALPDGSYPIEDAADLANAAILARSGHSDVKAARRLIARRANELGVANPLKKPKAEKAMNDWASAYQPMPVRREGESPGNSPRPRRAGQLAPGHEVTAEPPMGDPHDAAHVDVHLWQQPYPIVSGGVTVATVAGQGPLASSILSHQGHATVQVIDAAGAASPHLRGQLAAPPEGVHGMPHRTDRTAPSTPGVEAFETPRRPGGPASLPPPGAMFSNRAPGE